MMRAARPGDYRHRIAIQRPVTGQDAASGEALTSWEVVAVGPRLLASVAAECLTGPGGESKKSGAITADVDLRVTTRWFPPAFDPAWRIVWDGFAYDVRSVELDSTGRREYRLTCKNTREAVVVSGVDTGFSLEDGSGLMLLESGEFMLQE